MIRYFFFIADMSSKAKNVFGNGDEVSQIAVGVVGMGLLGGFYAVKYYQRRTNKFFSSLLQVSSSKLSKIRFSYLLRGPIFVGIDNTPIKSLALMDSFRALAVIGANRTGKTIFISNYILNDMFPWWYRFFFPPRGLFLNGNQMYPTIREWLRSQISITDEEEPWYVMRNLLSKRRNEQRVRLFLQNVFEAKCPRFLCPQPAIIIVDQAEELLRAYRANFLIEFYDLVKDARDLDLFRLVLIINTENAVKALELMNGGGMFEIVQGPKVSREAIEKTYGEDFAKIFDDCDGCIGVAMDYVRDSRSKNMTAKDYAEMQKRHYRDFLCLVKEITLDEYSKAQVK
mmetsp:Transcript_12845/g.17623  ORF Transcript_12845/g.17623 Transcript_12845/m.17623 type:complete len:342 (+) Transcript_12845:98-1123(+)